jgi:phosphoglycerate dehydrogenase-like enzyme
MSTPLVLFALKQDTKKTFLPDYNPKDLPPFHEEWLEVSRPNPRNWREILLEKKPEVLVTCWETPEIPTDLILSGQLPLKYICHLTGSVKGYVSRELIGSGLLVSNWGSAISHTIAEHALLLALGALRSMPLWRDHMEEHTTEGSARWSIPARSLHGRKVGVHGFGAIARHLISLLKPFGVSISAYSAGVPAEMFAERGVRRCESLEELVTGIDVMFECEAWTPQTEGVVDARILGMLPQDAVFINVGRGALVDEDALGRLAAEGKIIVGLDVFKKEPLPEDSVLRTVPTALLSPHIAGPTPDAFPLCGKQAMENIRHYLLGQPEKIVGRVTLEIYDRTT